MKSTYCGYEIEKSFNMLSSRLYDGPGSSNARSSGDDLQNVLKQITQAANYRPTTDAWREANPLTSQYLATLRTFCEWIMESHETLRGFESEFVEALYKLLATQIGTFLAEYFVSSARIMDEKTLALDKLLSEGV